MKIVLKNQDYWVGEEVKERNENAEGVKFFEEMEVDQHRRCGVLA